MSSLGYIRISTGQQVLDQQRESLVAAGIDAERIYEDTISSVTNSRPGLDALLSYARLGDTVTVVRLDRLGRSLPMIFRTVEQLEHRGIVLRSLTESIDMSTAAGRMMVGVLASFAAYERDLLRERLYEARASVEAKGQRWGRPPALSPAQVRTAQVLRAAGQTPSTIAATLGCSRATVYRYTAEV
jgi:DNA invertase Pin-like site-specific DNA recombinase